MRPEPRAFDARAPRAIKAATKPPELPFRTPSRRDPKPFSEIAPAPKLPTIAAAAISTELNKQERITKAPFLLP